ncbi:MAG: elongation factor G, partial [Rhodocyclaceae bacterium]|nr:elongation factor G [Rhodocyclaceae bacterium]
IAVLPAVETVAVVINAQTGIEAVTQRMMERAAVRRLCRMIVVNKIDAENVDLPGLLDQIQETFGKECLPINLPAKQGATVVDCFFNPSGDSDFSSVAAAHSALIDQVVEVDEDLMTLYLEQGEDLQPEQLHEPFEKALREGHLIPICFVSARTGAGLEDLLDTFARLLPNPTEGNPEPLIKDDGGSVEELHAIPDPQQHVVAHVFKVLIDPFIGKLGIFRIHQGTITKDSQLFIGDGRKPFKVAHLLRLQGKNQVEIPEGVPGDICAVARVDEIHRDAVLHDSHEEDYLHLEAPTYPRPVFGQALVPRKHGDEQKLSEALHRLLDEDPCLTAEQDPRGKGTVLHGLGETHLKVILEQLESRWNVQVDTEPPSIPFRETIAGKAEARYRHKKQSGGAGQFGEVAIRIEPLERGAGLHFVDEVKGGVIPGQYIPAVEKGVRMAAEEGVLAGFPLHDLKVSVFDGKFHAVDSNEISFVTAARHALLEAAAAARPLLLEPLLSVQIETGENHFGDVSADLSARRGRLTGTDSAGAGRTRIVGLVPMAEMDGFESRMRAISGGDAVCEIDFSHYDAAPSELQSRMQKASHKG